MNDGVARKFHAWLDETFAGSVPAGIVAFNVNLYDSPFAAEVVGSTYFDPDDEDWVCEEAWTPSRPSRFDFPKGTERIPWAERLVEVATLLRQWMDTGNAAAAKLRDAEAVTVGFVDGNLTIVHQRSSRQQPD
jgi:hypothetical protein